ncbi:MAG: ribosomal protein S18-alanine N-acetyltransferase [Gammaproteobacteria bacterium]|nr:ribosomal protein S18-alanine N-acetyltransferase [Gammaproteobacteria bacterium]
MSVARISFTPELRPMQEKDIPAVLEIESGAYSHPWTEGIFRDCLRVGYNCWVATLDNIICGYGIMSVAVSESHILNICIRKELQRRGFGRQLLHHLLDLSRDHGANIVLLEVRPSNTNAIRLYESTGFAEVGRRKAYYPGDEGREDALILALDL